MKKIVVTVFIVVIVVVVLFIYKNNKMKYYTNEIKYNDKYNISMTINIKDNTLMGTTFDIKDTNSKIISKTDITNNMKYYTEDLSSKVFELGYLPTESEFDYKELNYEKIKSCYDGLDIPNNIEKFNK